MIIKGASGFGDAIYLYPIVKYYYDKGEKVIVKTNYSEIFRSLNCECIPYTDKSLPDIDCNYCSRKYNQETTQFEDMCILAGIKEKIELSITNNKTIENTSARQVCLIQKPYFPMNELQKRHDLMPNYDIIQQLINDYKDKFYFIQIGKSEKYENELPKFENIDFDATDKTNYMQLLNYVFNSNMIISQIGWGIAAAEVMNKKIFVLFADKGLKSSQPFFSSITPKKVITKNTSYYAIDNEGYTEIKKKFENAIK